MLQYFLNLMTFKEPSRRSRGVAQDSVGQLRDETALLTANAEVPATGRFALRPAIAIALACLTMLGVGCWREWVARGQQIQATETSVANLASSLARDAAATVEVADTLVAAIVSRLETEGTGAVALAKFNAALPARVAAVTRVVSIIVLDSDGYWLATSLPNTGPNLSDRDSFLHARDDHDRGPFIGRSVLDRTTGRWLISVSRRFQSADGEFAGVVIANIAISDFVDHYAELDLGPRSLITLLAPDGTLRARYPWDPNSIGRNLSNATVFAALKQSPAGSYETTTVLDGVRRFSGYRRSGRYPLIVVASVSTEEALRVWRANAILHIVITLGLTAAVGLLGVHLMRQVRRGRATADTLSESEERFHLLLESAGVTAALYMLDPGGRIESWNSGAERIKGYTPQEIIGKNFSTLFTPEDVAMGEPTRILRIASETGRFTYEAWRVRKDGVRFLASVAIDAIFRPDGTLRGFAKVTHDITAQRMGEEQRASDFTQRLRKADEKSEADTSARQVVEATNADLDRLARHLAKARDRADQANRAKSRFLAGMSHELRTPLNCILGYAQLLRVEGGLNARQGMRVGAMLEAGQHLLEMITCVLDLSEIESERVEMRAVAFDVQAVAEACLGLVRPLVDSKGLALGMAVAPGTPRDLVADPIWLRQVLLNLLGNAAKFTSQGSIELRLKPWADGSMLRIEVADTGPGVPADQRPRLFQEFERLDTAATRAVEGAGLGLSLSARLAGLMGGQIGHDDNPPGGSVFWLDLPRNTPATAPAAASDEPADQSAPSPARALHVLVVDDVLMNRDIAGSFLREAGHRVTCAEGGAEAVAAVENTDFDVVLMDVRMPEMDGLEATRRIRALPGARGRVPIVALTAQAFLDQIDECRAAGMDSHQVKPLQMEALLAAVARAFAAGPRPEGVAPPAIVVAPTSIDKRPQVLDADVFARTAACLSPEAVTSYLRTIAELGETLRRRLDASGAEAHADDELAEVAHTLAGSAGMFGFARLSSVGLRFERATRMGAAEAPALVGELRDAVEAMRREVYALTT